jgi:hypothetical protein
VRRLAAALAMLFAVACREEPKMRVGTITSNGVAQQDGSVRTTYVLHVTLPTHGEHYQMRDFVLIERDGQTHTPIALESHRSNSSPDEAVATFEINHDLDVTSLRVGKFSTELNYRSRSSRR